MPHFGQFRMGVPLADGCPMEKSMAHGAWENCWLPPSLTNLDLPSGHFLGRLRYLWKITH